MKTERNAMKRSETICVHIRENGLGLPMTLTSWKRMIISTTHTIFVENKAIANDIFSGNRKNITNWGNQLACEWPIMTVLRKIHRLLRRMGCFVPSASITTHVLPDLHLACDLAKTELLLNEMETTAKFEIQKPLQQRLTHSLLYIGINSIFDNIAILYTLR